MGRKARHTARTGDGGAELRHRKRQLKAAEEDHKKAELEFYDDPSENDHDSDEVESEGSEFGDEEEVLQLGEEDDDEDEDDENDDGEDDDSDNDDDVDEFGADEEKKRLEKMDSKWGKSKKTFYSADTAEFELEDDDAVAKDEESAALELQRKQTSMMDDEDFGFDAQDGATSDDDDDDEEGDGDIAVDDEDLIGDQLADLSSIVDESGRASVEQVKKDFSKMTKKDKLQIVNQTAPELLGLSAELEKTMREMQEVITPAITKLKEVRKRSNAYNTGMQYLVTRQNLMLNYIANISFYLLLRAEGKSVADHPVLEHLLEVKKQMDKLEPVDDAVNTQLHSLLTEEFPEDAVDDGLDKFIRGTADKSNGKKRQTATANDSASKKQKSGPGKSNVSKAEKEEAARFYEQAMREKQAAQQAKKDFYKHEKPGLADSDEDDDSGLEDGAKRGATYEIIKNKGLKAHKSKINRNPRVKKRMQYRKAIIRRKGQVRDVRVGEAGRYGGETTGIKSNLSRSRKIRS